MHFELAGAADDPALRGLLRDSPMGGDIRIALQREPCIDFANGIEGDRTDILVGRLEPHDAPVAMGACSLLTSYVNGVPTPVGYLGQLRIRQGHRGRAGVLRRGYAALRSLAASAEQARIFVTTVINDNVSARRVLEADLPGLPRYRALGDLLSLTFSTAARRRERSAASRATPEDLPQIVECLDRYNRRFQFAPCWTRANLLSATRARGLRPEDFWVVRRGSRIVGCLACWDQRAFKQIVVHGYSPRLRLLRPLWNTAARLTGAPGLPPPGSSLPVVFLSHLAVDEDDTEVFDALLRAGLAGAASRGAERAILGLAERNPLAALAARWRPRSYRSRAYVVYWPEGESAAQRVDRDKALHLEMAIL